MSEYAYLWILLALLQFYPLIRRVLVRITMNHCVEYMNTNLPLYLHKDTFSSILPYVMGILRNVSHKLDHMCTVLRWLPKVIMY